MQKYELPYDSEKNIFLSMKAKEEETYPLDLKIVRELDALSTNEREEELLKIARLASLGQDDYVLHGVATLLDGILNKHGSQKSEKESWILELFNKASDDYPVTPDEIQEKAMGICESETDARAVVLANLVNTQYERRMFCILASVLASILTETTDNDAWRKQYLSGE